MFPSHLRTFWLPLLLFPLLLTGGRAAASSEAFLVEVLGGPVAYIKGEQPQARFALHYETRDGAEWKREGSLLFHDEGDGVFRLFIEAGDRSGLIQRDEERTEIRLFHQNVLFRGEGAVEEENRFLPGAMIDSLATREAPFQLIRQIIQFSETDNLARGLMELLRFRPEDLTREEGGWSATIDNARVTAVEGGGLQEVLFDRGTKRVRVVPGGGGLAFPEPDDTGYTIEEIHRDQMERTLHRGLVRAAHIQYQDATNPKPADGLTRLENGLLSVEEGQRLMVLWGGPEAMGRAHGSLLAREVRDLADSTLYTVGLVYSLDRGRWFHNEIEEAWARLEPHVPVRYLEEIRGIAEASGVSHQEVKLTNFFPELFHCSGFTVEGPATAGGKLYHGRVLDYMTNIGLQYAAVVTVRVRPGLHTWVDVGYAGFTGSVSGMNDRMVSIGEMGGGGEGLWDGMPMAHLIRFGLEEASTLEELKAIFRDTPRTCEYYYVFADAKTNESVGVYATPDVIEFVRPGETHPKLPRAIEGAVLLSSGSRYDRLCDRVEAAHGRIGVEEAIELMSRGVAMDRANLHNVLFIPEDLELHVANAGGRRIAAENPYYRYRLREILERFAPYMEEELAAAE